MLPLHRRSHPRYLVNKIVSYRHEGESLLTLTLDLGLGGMKIKTLDSLPKDERLKFKLVLGADSIWPRGRIAYSRFISGQLMVSGVQFIELSESDRASLKDYLGTLEDEDVRQKIRNRIAKEWGGQWFSRKRNHSTRETNL